MNKVQIKFINDAMDNDHLLSEWEFNFINDLAQKDEDYELSEKQNAVLNRIIDKINRS